jgi:hypothetical protein
MKPLQILPLAAAVFAVAACSKPAEPPAAATADSAAVATTPAAADASTTAAGAGGAVSAPQANGAINTDANKTNADVVTASNSFTESQAKGHIENAGYTDVTGLMKSPEGLWMGKAKKDGKTVAVALDFKGAVTAQ